MATEAQIKADLISEMAIVVGSATEPRSGMAGEIADAMDSVTGFSDTAAKDAVEKLAEGIKAHLEEQIATGVAKVLYDGFEQLP